MVKVNVYFDKRNHSKKYTYDIIPPEIPTKENYAMAISEAMVKADRRKVSRLNLGRYYNLLMKIIPNSNILISGGLTEDIHLSAYIQANLLNDKENPVIKDGKVHIKRWRTGVTQNKNIVIEIDDLDEENLNKIRSFYEELFGYPFNVLKWNLGKGFWLISTKVCKNIDEWLYDNCLILNPGLLLIDYPEYMHNLLSLDTKESMATDETIMKSGLFKGVGSFDLRFVFLNIKHEHCTLRTSIKRHGEKLELIE